MSIAALTPALPPALTPALLISSAVVAACVSGAVSILGMVISTTSSRALQSQRLRFDRDEARRKTDADIALSERKLELDQRLASWKRRVELAEIVLADFYKARDIIQMARSSAGFVTEGSSRQKAEWESDKDTRALNSYFRVIERLDGQRDFFAQLFSRRYQAAAVFGAEIELPYQSLVKLRGEIINAAQMLIENYGQASQETLDISEPEKRWREIIGWSRLKSDTIAERLQVIVSSIESACDSPPPAGV